MGIGGAHGFHHPAQLLEQPREPLQVQPLRLKGLRADLPLELGAQEAVGGDEVAGAHRPHELLGHLARRVVGPIDVVAGDLPFVVEHDEHHPHASAGGQLRFHRAAVDAAAHAQQLIAEQLRLAAHRGLHHRGAGDGLQLIGELGVAGVGIAPLHRLDDALGGCARLIHR